MAKAKPVTAAPELTVRSIIVGLVVALIIGSAYPYCVLKLGFGPNLSVVSAFFGFIALVLILRAAGTNARENNIVQTMGTSAGQTAFMAVLLAAFDLLNAKGVLNVESRIPAEVISQLGSRGHKLKVQSAWGTGSSPTVIMYGVKSGVISGGADPRRGRYALAW